MIVCWLLRRESDSEPVAVVYYDTNDGHCRDTLSSAGLNNAERIMRRRLEVEMVWHYISKAEFDVHIAFETVPVYQVYYALGGMSATQMSYHAVP